MISDVHLNSNVNDQRIDADDVGEDNHCCRGSCSIVSRVRWDKAQILLYNHCQKQ